MSPSCAVGCGVRLCQILTMPIQPGTAPTSPTINDKREPLDGFIIVGLVRLISAVPGCIYRHDHHLVQPRPVPQSP